MEIDKLFGLPAHPLLVHVPVVLVPLAGIIAIILAIKSGWLDRYGWWLVGISGVGAVGALLAAGSGEKLEGHIVAAEGESSALEKHADFGDSAKVVALLFFLIVVAIVVFRRWSAKKAANGGKDVARVGAAAILTSVLLVVSGGAATFMVAKAGHQGAKVTWHEDATNTPTTDGSGGGDGDSDGG
jgi:uncharacterized membrane protein